MLLVLPISRFDFPRVAKLAEVFGKLGGLSEQEALVVSIEDNGDLAEEYAALLRPLFKKVGVKLFGGMCPTGWPMACNFYFAQTARYLEFERGLQEPWYFFEADTVPLRPGWFDALVTEYNQSGKPFMGVRQETLRRNPETNVVVVEGHHMVGTGIYPPDLSNFSILYKAVGPDPWDVLCQWEIAPRMHPTELIQHNWGTANYRMGYGGAVVCEDHVASPWGISHAKALRPDAMLLHGAKDDTLADLVLADFAPGLSNPTKPTAVKGKK